MNYLQRIILTVSLCIFAVTLPAFLLRYEPKPTVSELLDDSWRWSGEPIIRMGVPGGVEGIYPRMGLSNSSAALFGIAFPALLLSAAAFVWAGREKKKPSSTQASIIKAPSYSPRSVQFWGFVLNDLWEGKQPLRLAFWGFYIIGAAVCFIFSLLVAMPFALIGALPVGYIAAFGIMFAYGIVATVGVWRSANASVPPY